MDMGIGVQNFNSGTKLNLRSILSHFKFLPLSINKTTVNSWLPEVNMENSLLFTLVTGKNILAQPMELVSQPIHALS